ncbi:Carboxypeptidase B [Folsomia candida]|uniref:Carboxypeptidase B n=1 Tax=Folsomia candida TaxID=158441 RepID=A0A226D341_FOLCA|nr:Carboxypeptidase B [Folsomia candida]
MLPIVGLTVGFISTLIGLTTSAMYDGHSMLRVHHRPSDKKRSFKGPGYHLLEVILLLGIIPMSIRSQKSGLEEWRYISWDAYYDLDSINQYLTVQSVGHPDLVTLTTIGKSFEGRDLFLLKINNGAPRNQLYGLILIFMPENGFHPRSGSI